MPGERSKCLAAELAGELAQLHNKLLQIEEETMAVDEAGVSGLTKYNAISCHLLDQYDSILCRLGDVNATSNEGVLAQVFALQHINSEIIGTSDSYIKEKFSRLFERLICRITNYIEDNSDTNLEEMGLLYLSPFLKGSNASDNCGLFTAS